MKKSILIIYSSVASLICTAQIVNGNFETWTPTSWEDLDTAQTSNPEMLRKSKPLNATKVSPAQNGNYAIKLETSIIGNDTDFAYVLFGDFGDEGPKGGFPYTQKPSTINGYYKAGFVSGDSAAIIVDFRKNGTSLAMNLFKIGTSQNAFTSFSFPLSIATYSVSPDSVVLAIASSTPTDIDSNATPKNGTWIILDNISFGGSGITQQIPNTNFEKWTTVNIENPQGWATFNVELYSYFDKKLHAVKTTDKYKGNYAIKLTTHYIDSNDAVAAITNSNKGFNSGASGGGVPFNKQIDTLCGYYKYTPAGADTGAMYVSFYKSGSSITGQGYWFLPAANYTYFQIPIFLVQTPDTMRIDISSSNYPISASNHGSVLFIDEIQLKSAPLNTGIGEMQIIVKHNIFPNPAKQYVNIDLFLEQQEDMELYIYDNNGKLVHKSDTKTYLQGRNLIRINTDYLSSGNYFYSVTGKDHSGISGKFIIQ